MLQKIDVKADRLVPLRRVDRGVPLIVEPLPAEGVHERGDERHVLAPAGLAAQADAVDLAAGIVQLRSPLLDLLPGRLLGHLDAGLLEQVLAVEQHRALGVERQRVQLAVIGQAFAHRLQHVLDIVVGGQILERDEPVLRGPDRDLVGADRHDVELAALGRDVGRDPLAKHVLLEHDPFQVDVRVLLLELPRRAPA